MTEYRYSISLRVSHPTMNLEAVTHALGLSPGALWKVGEPRRTPNGTPLKGVYEKGFWTAQILEGGSAEQGLSSALERALDLVAAGSSLFGDIAATGGDAEFFIGWFFDEGNSGDVLDHRLLARLADMRINLSFDVYGDADSSG